MWGQMAGGCWSLVASQHRLIRTSPPSSMFETASHRTTTLYKYGINDGSVTVCRRWRHIRARIRLTMVPAMRRFRTRAEIRTMMFGIISLQPLHIASRISGAARSLVHFCTIGDLTLVQRCEQAFQCRWLETCSSIRLPFSISTEGLTLFAAYLCISTDLNVHRTHFR